MASLCSVQQNNIDRSTMHYTVSVCVVLCCEVFSRRIYRSCCLFMFVTTQLHLVKSHLQKFNFRLRKLEELFKHST